MNTTSSFSFLESIATRFQPPAWAVDEGQQRLVLFLNHVLMQEKQAQDRLLRQKGRVVHVRWGLFGIDLVVTPAGLVDRATPAAKPDLVLSLAPESPWGVLQSTLAGKAPPLKIEGDVQLAADVGWLAENLRWDAEEDLSRLIGDGPAHGIAEIGRKLLAGLKQLVAKGPLSQPGFSEAAASQAPAPARSQAATVKAADKAAGATVNQAAPEIANEVANEAGSEAAQPPQSPSESRPASPKASA